jgi:outer membrane protein TolC
MTLLMWALLTSQMPVLSLDVVLESLDHHPTLRAVESEVGAAEAKRMEKKGAYDLKLDADAGTAPLGTWTKTGAGLGVGQILPVLGRPKVGLSYRVGAGHPDWAGDRMTSEWGEVRAEGGVELARDLLIDPERAGLEQAQWALRGARADAAGTRLNLTMQAVQAYWNWVAAGHLLRVEAQLVKTAEIRAAALERQVEKGAVAAVVLEDNRRLLLSRQAAWVEAQQVFAQAGQVLSFFFRNARGDMNAPHADQLPFLDVDTRPVPTLADAERWVERRPELRGMTYEMGALGLEKRLADNDQLPRISTRVYASRDLGATVPVGLEETSNRAEVFAAVAFSLPVQRRKARAQAAAASAKRRAVEAKRQVKLDELKVKVRNAHTKLDAARQKVALAREALSAARRVEAAERRRFEEGLSDLLAVNLREQTTASEARKLVLAQTALGAARILFRLTAGLNATPSPPQENTSKISMRSAM